MSENKQVEWELKCVCGSLLTVVNVTPDGPGTIMNLAGVCGRCRSYYTGSALQALHHHNRRMEIAESYLHVVDECMPVTVEKTP